MVGGVAHAHIPNTTISAIGATPAQTQARFTTLVYHNLSVATPAQLAKISDLEWASIFHEWNRLGGVTATLDSIVSARAPGIYAHYHYVTRGGTPPPAPPNANEQTLEDLYLVFRTDTYGLLDPRVALYETCVLGGFQLKESYEFGETIGGELYWLIDKYDPALSYTIGANISWFVDHITNIADLYSQGSAYGGFSSALGDWEYGLDTNFFGINMDSLGSIGYGFGDFGIFDDIGLSAIGACFNPGDC